MRAVIQRVKEAQVVVDGQVVAQIARGLLVLVGIGSSDTTDAADYLANKIIELRIFEDDAEKMNLSLLDIQGELLVVSQFTLYGDCRKGKRPSFSGSARPETARVLYHYLLDKLGNLSIARVQAGVFAARMNVELVNDGPVTILLDSDKTF